MVSRQSVSLPVEVFQKLRDVSEETNVPAARILRELITTYLGEWLDDWKRENRKWTRKK